MTWQEITDWLGPFVWGFALGFFWYPIWQILKKIWEEAKLAKKEWKQPRG